MTLKSDDERRHAQRFPLPKAAHATFGGFAAEIVEVSLIGCQIVHAERIAPRSHWPLRFKWRGSPVRIEATVVRSEMRSIGGKPGFLSGLAFCESPEQSPAVIREIVGWLRENSKSAPVSAPAVEAPAEDEPDVVSGRYLQCRLRASGWEKLYTEDPEQPREGFTIVAPENDAEADVLCRAYETANAQKRQKMRASFEHMITQSRPKET